jgi:DNA-binding beta-propeller fold protein YncE
MIVGLVVLLDNIGENNQQNRKKASLASLGNSVGIILDNNIIISDICSTIYVALGAATTDITVGKTPLGIGVNPTTNMIYVAKPDSDSVSVINGTSGKVLSTATNISS